MLRPKSITVVGWIWIVLGSFTIIFNTVSPILLVSALSLIPDGRGQWTWSQVVHVFIISPSLAIMILVGIFVIISAIYFLKLRRWARISLEIISCLGIIEYIISGIASYVAKDRIAHNLSTLNDLSFLLRNWFSITWPLICLVLVSLFVFMLIFFHGKTVREAFKGENKKPSTD